MDCVNAFNITAVGCDDGNTIFFDNDTQDTLYG